MAVPAFIERVTHEDPDSSRRLSGHDWESAVECIHGGTLTVATFKTLIEEGMSDGDRSRFAVGFQADGAYDFSAPDPEGLERILCVLIEFEIH